ncbi:hypothetical protein PCASD_13491 [Puccinia coronata f. sp. avenae]|uniref:Uncharacterized protein n=1 Tax=Puccinia coronata f. sp. avenae TaxID=200324 RepID=A0A2N5TEH6_9BASI|nr:hypothetical protein PCASD_13491 [Puccinia coronata f. sp. avenae]
MYAYDPKGWSGWDLRVPPAQKLTHNLNPVHLLIRTAVNSARKARRCSSLSPPLLPAAPSPLGAGSVSRPIASPVSDVCLALLPTVASQLGLGSLRIPNIFANSPSLPWAVLPWIYLPSSLAHRNP